MRAHASRAVRGVGWIQNGYALEGLQSSKNLITMDFAKAVVRSKCTTMHRKVEVVVVVDLEMKCHSRTGKMI